MKPRYPVSINGEMLNAIFNKPDQRSEQRMFVARFIASLRPVIRVTRKGLSFFGVRGEAQF